MTTSTAQDQSLTAPSAVPPPLPNVGIMAQGFDALTYDLLAPGACNRGAIFDYQNTARTGDGAYLLPPNLTYSSIDATEFAASSTQIFTSYDMQQSVAASASLSADDPEEGLSFTGSASYAQSEQVTTSFNEMFVQSRAEVQCWRLAMLDGARPSLTATFTDAVANLPPEYDGPGGAYQQLLGSAGYGTHYALAAVFGGRVYQTFTMTQASASELWQQQVDVNAQASEALAGAVKLSASTSTSSYQAFASCTTASEVAFVGGTPAGAWNDWVPTVASLPEVVSVTLAPIYTLLTPDYFPQLSNIGVLQANLETAYEDYMAAHGTDPLAGAVTCRRWSQVQASPAYTLRPYSPTTEDAGAAVLASTAQPLVGLSSSATPLVWVVVDPANSASSGIAQIGQPLALQWVNLGILMGGVGFLPSLAWPNCLEVDTNKNVVVSDEAPSKNETWTVMSPFVSGGTASDAAPLFPGAVIQLRGGSTGGYLAASGSAIKTITDALDTATLWTLQPWDGNAPACLAFDGTGRGSVDVPSIDALSGAYAPVMTMTVSAWVCLDAAGGPATLVANTGFSLATGAGDQASANTYRSVVAQFTDAANHTWRAEGGQVPVGVWTYVSVSWSLGGQVQAAVNNQQVALLETTGQQPLAYGSSLRMGLAMDGTGALAGRLGPVTLLASGYPYGWAGYWLMNAGAGTEVRSYAMSGNGTLVGDGVSWSAG
jgi:hypothetical protein